MKVIAFIGNFGVSYSTENERLRAFKELGHKVITLQENQVSAEDILKLIDIVDMLVYSHTHGWEIVGLIDVFEQYKSRGIPVVTVHLDLWAGLEREKDCGVEATWFASHLFMADGSPQAVKLYEKLGINWYYLKPAVAKDQCYIAQPDHEKYPHEIVFTGSRGYHSEYPFRPRLVDWLKRTYGDKFGHYGNDGIKVLREHELNVMLASSKIVVGDSCFGGRPNYVSDRYFETRGRGGFLLHPKTEGVDDEGVVPYRHEDLNDLKQKIDYYLAHDKERELLRHKGFEWVKNNETYTHRAEEIIKAVFNEDD